MALIKCPECGKEISDKSDKCIHCGYPIMNYAYNIYETIEGVEYKLTFLKDYSISKIDKIKKIMALANCDVLTAKEVADKYCPTIVQKSNYPKCPTCNSTNISPIDIASRVLDSAVFGVYGTKRYKTFQCNHCGYEW